MYNCDSLTLSRFNNIHYTLFIIHSPLFFPNKRDYCLSQARH